MERKGDAMHNMELDLDNRDRCNILLLRHATPTPGQLRQAAERLLGHVYRETHFPDLSAEGAMLSINVGMRVQQQFLRGRRIKGIATSREARAGQTLAAIVYGARHLCSGFEAPTPVQTLKFSAWNSPHALSMAREADVRIDELRASMRRGALPDYEETVFVHRDPLGLQRLLVDTYQDMSAGVDEITDEFTPGIYIVVGHAPNLAIFACGKFRNKGSNGVWGSLTAEQHARVLGGIPVPGQQQQKFHPLRPCEGFWYVLDRKTEQHGLIPVRHSPGIMAVHAESVSLQDDHRRMFIEQRLQPAAKADGGDAK